MTPEEQSQVNAAMAFMEKQCGNLAREGANAMALAEQFAQQVKALTSENEKLKAEIAELKKPKAEVIPIQGEK